MKMANWCAIGMTLTLENEETAKKLYNSLVNAKDGRDLDFHGDKILYGAEIRLSSHSNDIGIQADVSSALEREDMIHFVKWLRQFVPATKLTASVDYSEFSSFIFGKYELRNGLLKDYYLQGKEIPDTPDCEDEEAYSAYCDEINARIDAKEGELIYDFNADEKPDLMKTFGRWNVRIVRQNENYGRHNCLVHAESDPLIEFYDNKETNDDEWKRGQFVSRYYAETLFERCYDQYKWGLQLDGGIPEWYVSPHEMAAIYRWLQEQLPQYQFTAKQLSDLNYCREKEHLEADRIQNALARAVIRKVREAGHGKCYLGRYNRNEWDPYGLQEYRHGMVYNFQYDFVIPTFDPQIQEWLLEYQHHHEPFTLIEKIGNRVLEMNGYIVFWS